MRRWKLCTLLTCVLAAFPVVSWWLIDYDERAAGFYPGGVVLCDCSGAPIRVTLDHDEIDCRPGYRAAADDWIVLALVAAEDGSFFQHCGVRPLSIARAAWQNLVGRRIISGASTITMQTVRLLSPHRRDFWNKWCEAVAALKMERRHDKLWIISQYLNRAPFGANLVGIDAAAEGWFGKRPKNLWLGEAALLAGMVQSPSRFRPDRGYQKALARRDYVLARMLELGFVTAEQVEAAKTVKPEVAATKRPFRHPYYCDWLLAGAPGAKYDAAPLCEGERRVQTALNPNIQEICATLVDAAANAGGYSVAAVVTDVETGHVLALTCSGGYSEKDNGQVNTAIAPRPAGSTLKPFLMEMAMNSGIIDAKSKLNDVPAVYGDYVPQNFDGKFRGVVSCRDAIVLSLNMPFIEMLQQIGVGEFGGRLRELGFRHIRAPYTQYGLGLAVGNADVTLVELTRAYAHFAWRARRPGPARVISGMLSGDERSSVALGHIADVVTASFAWKTGTSSAYRDAWTVLWNRKLAIGVWCGHLRGGFGDRAITGAEAAAPVAWSIARAL